MRVLRQIGILIAVVLAAVTSKAQAEFKIGVSVPLTGEVAEYGVAVRNGFELARQESTSSQAVSFSYQDNGYDPATSVSAFNSLVKLSGADMIFNWGEAPLNAIAPIAERQKIPVMAMSLDPAPSVGKKYVMRSINHSAEYAAVLAKYLQSKGYKKIGLIVAEDPFFSSMTEGLRQHLASDQSLKVAFSFLPDEKDFRTAARKFLKSDYDAIGVFLFPGQVSTFYRQAGSIGFKKPTFGTDIFQSRTEIKHAEGNMEGAVYANISVPEDFQAKYMRTFGNDLQIAYAYNAYEFAKLAYSAFGGNGVKRSPERIMSKLQSDELLSSAPFSLVNSKDGGTFYSFPVVMKEIRGLRAVEQNLL